MRKNKMMRLASVLLVMTMLTTCAISGTFAKYVTQDSASDTARVAKWGVEVLASGNLFGTTYKDETVAKDDASLTVQSFDKATDVVAPGTKNIEGFTVQLTGQPEVDYKTTVNTASATEIKLGAGSWGVMVKATGLNLTTNLKGLYQKDGSGNYTLISTDTYWTSGDYYELHDAVELADDYYPIVWKLSKDGAAATEAASLAVAMGTMQTDFETKDGDANTSLDLKYVLTWEWPFDSSVNSRSNSAADTILGNLMADQVMSETDGDVVIKSGDTYVQPVDVTNYELDLSVEFTLTVEQVD